MEVVNSQLESFNSGLPMITYLEQEQKEFSEQLSLDKERYKQLKAARKNDFTALHIVEFAETPVIKSRPKRSILVISATAIIFILSLLIIMVLEKYKSINWKALKDA
jgi:LPS O-antigen subunit length determinant protein (WzzB/FepE family)